MVSYSLLLGFPYQVCSHQLIVKHTLHKSFLRINPWFCAPRTYNLFVSTKAS